MPRRDGPGAAFLLSLRNGRLAHRAAAEQVDDREKHDRTDQRHQERSQGDALVDAAAADDEAGEEGADDADDDVEKNALLRVSAHHDAGEPAHDAANDKPDDNTDHEPCLLDTGATRIGFECGPIQRRSSAAVVPVWQGKKWLTKTNRGGAPGGG